MVLFFVEEVGILMCVNAQQRKIRKSTILLYVALAVIVVVAAFFFLSRGSSRSLDEVRMADIKTIVAALELYAVAHNGMYPESLDVLRKNEYLTHDAVDPKTREPYRYLLRDRADYAICTTWDDGGYRCIAPGNLE